MTPHPQMETTDHMSDELQVMSSNPLGDGALTINDASAAFRSLREGKPQAARATAPDEEPEAPPETLPEDRLQFPGDEDRVPIEETEAPETEPNVSESDDQPDEQPDEKTKRFSVKVDGVESKVSFEELRNGYQRHADYQRKMADVEQARQQADALRQSYQSRIDSVIPQLESAFNQEFGDVRTITDVQNLSVNDPARYVRWQAAQLAVHHARQEQQQVNQQAQERQRKANDDYLADQSKQLYSKLPELADREKGPKMREAIRNYLVTEGFTSPEIEQANDHRMVLIARKAMLFDQAQQARAKAAQTLKTVPTVQKPGATRKTGPNAERGQAAFGQLQKSGRVADAADVFRSMKLFG